MVQGPWLQGVMTDLPAWPVKQPASLGHVVCWSTRPVRCPESSKCCSIVLCVQDFDQNWTQDGADIDLTLHASMHQSHK